MSYFDIKYGEIDGCTNDIAECAKQLGEYIDNIDKVRGCIGIYGKNFISIKVEIDNVLKEMRLQKEQLKQWGKALSDTKQLYLVTEQKLSNNETISVTAEEETKNSQATIVIDFSAPKYPPTLISEILRLEEELEKLYGTPRAYIPNLIKMQTTQPAALQIVFSEEEEKRRAKEAFGRRMDELDINIDKKEARLEELYNILLDEEKLQDWRNGDRLKNGTLGVLQFIGGAGTFGVGKLVKAGGWIAGGYVTTQTGGAAAPIGSGIICAGEAANVYLCAEGTSNIVEGANKIWNSIWDKPYDETLNPLRDWVYKPVFGEEKGESYFNNVSLATGAICIGSDIYNIADFAKNPKVCSNIVRKQPNMPEGLPQTITRSMQDNKIVTRVTAFDEVTKKTYVLQTEIIHIDKLISEAKKAETVIQTLKGPVTDTINESVAISGAIQGK